MEQKQAIKLTGKGLEQSGLSFSCSNSVELDELLVDKSCSEYSSEKYLSAKTLKCDYRSGILMKFKEVCTHSPISLQKSVEMCNEGMSAQVESL